MALLGMCVAPAGLASPAGGYVAVEVTLVELAVMRVALEVRVALVVRLVELAEKLSALVMLVVLAVRRVP